jgi:hypothetical protein
MPVVKLSWKQEVSKSNHWLSAGLRLQACRCVRLRNGLSQLAWLFAFFGTLGPSIKRLNLAKLLSELELTVHGFVALSSQEPIPNTNQIDDQKNNLENDQAVLPVSPFYRLDPVFPSRMPAHRFFSILLDFCFCQNQSLF